MSGRQGRRSRKLPDVRHFQGDSAEKDGAGPHPSQRLAMVQKELALDLLITSTGALKHLQDLLSIKQF